MTNLNLEQVLAMHAGMKAMWRKWEDGRPKSWKGADDWLAKHDPITMACRYGQNSQICKAGSTEDEARHWENLRNLNELETFNIAIATHIRYGNRCSC